MADIKSVWDSGEPGEMPQGDYYKYHLGLGRTLLRKYGEDIDSPYLKTSALPTYNARLTIKPYYTTLDICKILGFQPVRRGYYPEAEKVGTKYDSHI